MTSAKYNVSIIKSNRKTLSLSVSDTNTVIVRAPYHVSNQYIQDFLTKNHGWIEKQIKKAQAMAEERNSIRPLTDLEIQELAAKACEVFKNRVLCSYCRSNIWSYHNS